MQFKKALTNSILLKSINVIILFFSNMVFVRILGAEATGIFFYLITILAFITLLVSGSIESGITFYASKNIDNFSSFAVTIILLTVIQIFISLSIILVTVHSQTSLSLTYLTMFVISNILISNFTALYFSRKWFLSLNVYVLTINFIVLMFFWIILERSRSDGISQAEKVYVISFSVQAIGLVLLFFSKIKKASFKILSIDTLKKVFKYSSLALVGNISFFLVTRLDYLFVKIFCSSVALGNYLQVSKIAQLFVILPAMAASVIFPFAANAQEEILSEVQSICRLMTAVIASGALVIIIFGNRLFPWFFGTGFDLMYPSMLFYLPGMLGLCISSLLASYISGKGFIFVNVLASFLALVITVAGDLIFIPKYGINAASAVSSVAYISCMFFLLRHCIKKYNARIPAFFSISFNELKYFFSYVTNKKNN